MLVHISISYTQQFTEMRHSQESCNLPYIFQAWLGHRYYEYIPAGRLLHIRRNILLIQTIYRGSSIDYCHAHVTSNLRFSRKSQMLDTITFRSLIKNFTQSRQNKKRRRKIHFHLKPKHSCHCADLHGPRNCCVHFLHRTVSKSDVKYRK